MIEIKEFFDIDEKNIPVKKPINRNACTDSDIQYKIKYIKAMQELGMIVTIDKIGNICGTIPGKLCKNKSVICGSHTDSVDNGGQFDGPLGVYAALKTAEDIINSGKNNAVNYKAVIYACEESTRFKGKACIGSKYLRGDISDFTTIISRDGLTLDKIVTDYKTKLFHELKKSGCAPILEVDKVIEDGEIITALEGHIEQADTLHDHKNNIGLCTSITAPYRLKVDINDIETAADFICDLVENAKEPENLTRYRVTVPEFSIKNDYNEADLANKQIITLRSVGENNHSGATPMDKRKDAVYGTAKLIKELSKNSDVHFIETSTPHWGPNQINDCCELKLAIDSDSSAKSILNYWLSQKDSGNITDTHFEKIDDINSDEKGSGLYIDVRQQIGINSKLSSEMIFDTIKDIIHTTHKNVFMKITSKGEPFSTNTDLINSASQICEEKEIPYEVLRSWAGHDLATLTHDENARTLLLFCDSTGGSHNSTETTTVDSMNKLVQVESLLAQKELDRANELYLKDYYNFLNNELSKVMEISRELNIDLKDNGYIERG